MHADTHLARSAPVFLTVAVWGQSFLDIFLEHALPSYLGEGGIPELPARGYTAKFWLYTTREWVGRIEEHAVYRRLVATLETHIVCIDELVDVASHQNVYETMNACHQDFILRAAAAKAAMIFYSPDALWSKGSLSFTLDQAEAGKRAVLMAGVRAEKEPVLSALTPLSPELQQAGLDARTLVYFAVQHPHRITRSLSWNNPDFDIGWASHLYWPVVGQGYLGRCFHLHTFYVHPRLEARPEVAHDYDWLEKIGLQQREICVVEDSDDMFALELSPAARGINGRLGERNHAALADWARRYAMPDHRRYARRAIRFHASGDTEWRWWWIRLCSAVAVRWILVRAGIQACLGLELHGDGTWRRAGGSGIFGSALACLWAMRPWRRPV